MRQFISAALSLLTLLLFTAASCSKSDGTPPNALAGSWVFTSQVTFSNSYPSVLTNPNPPAHSFYTNSTDSIRISFDRNGKYMFVNYRQPIATGSYSIAQDSLLVIQPDTSAFLRFNYTLPLLVFGNGTAGNEPTNTSFTFVSDTILFHKMENQVVFSGVWISKADKPVMSGGDTLLLNQVTNYFQKQ